MWGAVKGTGAILLREGEVQKRHGGCLWAAEGLSNGGGFKSGMTLRTELELTGRSYMRTHFSSIQVRRQAVRSWHRELAELRQQLGSSLWLQAWQPTSGEGGQPGCVGHQGLRCRSDQPTSDSLPTPKSCGFSFHVPHEKHLKWVT